MLNIDTRILDDVTADQYWLLSHILKRADADLACYPSNKTLCTDTGWEIKKLQKIKAELIEKGLLVVRPRKNKDAQTSNEYKIQTDLIGIYVPAKRIHLSLEADTPPTLFSDTPPAPKTGNKELTNEVLTNEVYHSSWIGEKVIGKMNEFKRSYGIPGKVSFTKEREKMIKARFLESKSTSLEPIYRMIEHRCKVWKGTEFEKYIRIETLFRASKFVGYMEEAEAQPEKDWTEKRTDCVDVTRPSIGNISW